MACFASTMTTAVMLLVALTIVLTSSSCAAYAAKVSVSVGRKSSASATSVKTLKTCPLGQARSLKTGKCSPCAAGSYNWYATANHCQKCPAGTYTTIGGVVDKSLCQPCAPDSYSLPGSRACTRCPRGYVRLGGQHSQRCRRCRTRRECRCSRSKRGCANLLSRPNCPYGLVPPGPYGSYFPNSVCVQPDNGCPRGTKLITWARRAICADIKTGKIACPSSSIFDGIDRCLSCEPGSIVKFNPQAKRKQCARCSGNSVSNGGTSTECRKCPTGYAPTYNRKSCFNTIPPRYRK